MKTLCRSLLSLAIIFSLTMTACTNSNETTPTPSTAAIVESPLPEPTATDMPLPTPTEAPPPTPEAAVATEQPTPEEPPEPIRIGLLTDETGRFARFGTDITLAAQLAVDQINEAGGINGSLLELIIFDTTGDNDLAVAGYQQLVDEDVFAVVGPISSGEAAGVFALAAALQTPVITGSANQEGITDLGEGWAFRNTATNSDLYALSLPVWASLYDIQTALLLFDESFPVSAAAARNSIPNIVPKVGIELVNSESPITYMSGETNFAPFLQQAAAVEADAIIILSAPVESVLIAQELVLQGETRPILGHPAQNSDLFLQQGGADINNWIIPSTFDNTSTEPDTVAYLEVMNVIDPTPPTTSEAANNYDAVRMLAQVMQAAGINGRTPLLEAREAIQMGLLNLTDFDGVAGQSTFGGDTDAQKTVYVYLITNGQIERLP